MGDLFGKKIISKQMENKKLKFLIITPSCNEEVFLPNLIESVVNQNFLPDEWIIVDDGSVDNSINIIKEASLKNPWIRYIRKEKKEKRSPGKNVIDTFYKGFNNRNINDFDVVVKLDADLSLPKDYFATINREMIKNSNIGICGGICTVNGNVEGLTNLDHVRGAIKAYRKECFNQIGGLLNSMGWDTVDEHHARFLGWQVYVIDKLKVEHHRETNYEFGFYRAAFKNGKMLYYIRMDFFLLIINCLKWSFRFPFIILGFVLFLGYIAAFFSNENKIVSRDLGKFIRMYRYKKIKEKIWS